MRTGMHLVSMHLLHTMHILTIAVLFSLLNRHSYGLKTTAMIRSTKAITSICKRTEHPYRDHRIRHPLPTLVTRIKTAPFIYLRRLPRFIRYGTTRCSGSVYRRCLSLSATPWLLRGATLFSS